MKQGKKPTLALCTPFHHAIELIGRRWTGAIISLLLQRVEYSLTKKGRALAAAIAAIGDWAHKWGTAPAIDAKHKPARARR